MADEDQIKGKAMAIDGKIKEEAGDAVGDDELKHEGRADQTEGKVQKGDGDANDMLSD